jgi:hypothetical protein
MNSPLKRVLLGLKEQERLLEGVFRGVYREKV